MPSWTATLPKLCNIRPERPVNTVLRSETDTGPAKTRPRYSAAPRYLRGSIYPHGAQRLEFENFFNDVIGRGALAFTWEKIDPITDEDREVRIEVTDEELISPAPAFADRIFRIDLRVEILP